MSVFGHNKTILLKTKILLIADSHNFFIL